MSISEKKLETIQKASFQGSRKHSTDTLCVYVIGKYQFTPKEGGKKFQVIHKGDKKKCKMTTKSGRSVCSQAVTMIVPATGWIEIRIVPSIWADLVTNQVELA